MIRGLALFPFLFFLLVGCGANQGSLDENQEKNRYMNVENTTIKEVNDRKESEEISKHIANLAAKVPNVRNATAVVIGKYAIVGIDVDKDLDRSKVGTIKYSVAEALKDDPYGARAVVVADADLNARLMEIGEDIKNGRPLQGILNELADITGRLMPEIPGDIQDTNPENLPENQKNDLNQKDKNMLDKQQDDQSNFEKNQ
ncbi:YhcN/YlaJ family sporulation lipoprotein [Fervidibacillus halotolerans]|uniref:YhcN/YlaJ family sporulation lipoprotein n=1 Tax=Fervidibacillus halotolerans TaxID=2980027 RepID=A0A9E8M1N2_9BACI|nr:YhcN/YlaJ family sporulation lipoprotein [Fervidibacillus halotolerans]WAA13250.1 YhcN/YlaJ family sporulation lipoprotein [Fervidibacillus halotolerans]